MSPGSTMRGQVPPIVYLYLYLYPYLHLALVYGIDEKTAIRCADSARTLLGEAAEQASQ